MRKILYRAKRKDKPDEWIEGYYARVKDYLTDADVHVIFPLDVTLYSHNEFSEYVEIIPETICRLLEHPCYDSECTDQRFFQNDIIGLWHSRWADPDNTDPDATALVVDEWSITENGSGRWFPQDTIRVRVIGNAYDNPELIFGRNMRHFMSGLCDYPDDYHEQHRKITDKYGIHGAHAGCYICTFENEYLCHQYNGGCPLIEVCRGIHEQERDEGKD